ncbi:hypothetical protein ACFVVC_02250 [Pseudarthrobacter sp. NPDC058196]|uniref:hypothetical protein n=1 Tax=Pseudarthrobacter sp. NPDC058196 TaxID=3346376 RepID=UPI0036DF2518
MYEYDTDHQDRAVAADEPRRRMNPRVQLTIRRSLALAIALGMACGIFHVVFRTDVLAPVLAYAEPVKDGIAWVIEDPKRAWMAFAILVIPHIGLYYLLFEDRK